MSTSAPAPASAPPPSRPCPQDPLSDTSSLRWSFAAYVGERFRPWPFLPLALFLATPGLVDDALSVPRGAGLAGLAPSFLRLGLALLLLLGLRIADDLADRSLDQREHPERHTARADPRGARRACLVIALIGVAGLAALPPAPLRVGGLCALFALLGAWYRWRPRQRKGRGRALNALVVLLKYPALIALLGGSTRAPLPGLLALSYGGALGYELAHDPQARPSFAPVAAPVAALVAALAGALVGALAWAAALVLTTGGLA